MCTWSGLEHSVLSLYRLQAEVEEVLEGRTEVTNEDLEKLQYTEQVYGYVFIHADLPLVNCMASVLIWL